MAKQKDKPVAGVVVALLLITAAAAKAAPGAVVTLRDSVELAGAEVTLAAVGRIDTADGDLAARLALISLAPSPPPGRVLDLGRLRIQEALAKAGLEGEVRLEGPDLVRVTRRTRRVSGAEIAAAAVKAAERAFKGDGVSKVSCEPRTLPLDVEVPAGSFTLEAVPPTMGAGPVVLVAVHVLSGEKPVATRSVSLRVKVERQIAVAARDLPRGWKIGAGDLVLENRETAGVQEGFRSLEDALGKELKVPVRTGEPVFPSRLASPWVVQRGDGIELAFTRGSVQVTARGRALQGGGVGDRIEVENAATGRKLRGRVTGPGRVEIEGGDR